MRLGIFGGTFDPPHLGHLLLASDVVEQLGLDELRFIPAATQPLKAGSISAPPGDRLAMVRLLAGDDPRFTADPIEIERDGLSFTADTLEAIAGRDPGAERFLVIGADVLMTFSQWRDPERVLALATLVVMRRSGAEPRAVTGGSRDDRKVAGLGEREGRVIWLDTRRVDVSSTEIRARVRDGRSIHGFVPDEIARYIARAGLYR